METPASVVLDPEYVAGLEQLPLAELRHRRDVAEVAETRVSYLRRLIQGRLDIVGAQISYRSGGDAPEDLEHLVGRLPEILGDKVHAPGLGRLPIVFAPQGIDPQDEERLERMAGLRLLGEVDHLDDTILAGLVHDLSDYEHEVSATRKQLQGVVDRLKAEIIRRYKDGEISADSLVS